ncbi:MAG: N-acetylglucosamine-6-phosphate deacetylase [Negativicutes bacterium]|jgi:N-acetylglucosamine-6-phosphate deacetylase
MKFINANLVFPHELLENGVLAVENGMIVANSATGETIDCKGKFIIPGLIDIHVHGAGGADAMDATSASLTTFATTLLHHGTVAFLPTTMSASLDAVIAAVCNIRECRGKICGAEILGAHMEGPIISVDFKGAQAESTITPNQPNAGADFIRAVTASCTDVVKIATIAPERIDASEVVEACSANNIIASAGHTGVDYDGMKTAIRNGVRGMTHSFNAMLGIVHRKPGPIVAALSDTRINMEVIGDGVHVHPAVLDLVLKIKKDKACLISDSIRAMGMPNGEYDLGGQMTIVRDGMALLPNGTIAGSAFPLIQGIRTMVGFGWTLVDAVLPATLNPAKFLGVDDRLGSLEIGKEASFVILNDDLSIDQVWLRGVKVR